MRAACQHCSALQPVDWAPGHLCVACGLAVRSDVRCFWCAKWTPEAKFCRSCGAEVVPPAKYGAARMIKDAGTDRFTVPKMLRELDPDQVENFTRIYNAQAGVVTRHVDDVRFVQSFLFHRSYADDLEDYLVPQLPWSHAKLEHLSKPMKDDGDDLGRLKRIIDESPIGSTHSLATVACLRLGDYSTVREVGSLFRHSDGALKEDAALALTSWRVGWAAGIPREHREDLVEALKVSKFGPQAAVRLAYLGVEVDPARLKDALGEDPETSFAAALALDDVDRLRAALQSEDAMRGAAGRKLIELGVLQAVVEPILKSSVEIQTELVESALRREGPVPELADALLQIVETTEDATLRERAARGLCRQLRPEWARRIAKHAHQDRYIYQSLLSEAAALPVEAVEEVVDQMLEDAMFSMSQYGLKEAAARGAIGDAYVPRRIDAATPEVQKELIRMAEAQLEARHDPALERALYGVVFGDHGAQVRSAAWWALHRVYRQSDHRGEGPLVLSPAAIEAQFGSVSAFLPRLAAVISDPATMKEVGVYDFLARLFGSTDPSFLPVFFGAGEPAHQLVQAVLAAVRADYWSYLIEAMFKFLGEVGADPRWREDVIAGLESLGRAGNYHFDKTLSGLRLSRHGIPEESQWRELPPTFVPERMPAARPESWPIFLQVADQQLIHHRDEGLRRFLIGVAFDAYPSAIRIAAIGIVEDRGRLPELKLERSSIEAHVGPFATFAARLSSVLGDAELLADRHFGELLTELFRETDRDTVAALLKDEANGAALVEALGAARAALPRQRGDIDRLLDTLKPKPAVPIVEVSAPSPPVLPDANPWVAKQQEVERLSAALQKTVMDLMMGPLPPEEKSARVTQLQLEFQEQIKKLYAT